MEDPGRPDGLDNLMGVVLRMAKGKTKGVCVTCADCYFRQNMLCALRLDAPCATFRSAARGLEPERQLTFVFRTERTRAAYAFPQPTAG